MKVTRREQKRRLRERNQFKRSSRIRSNKLTILRPQFQTIPNQIKTKYKNNY